MRSLPGRNGVGVKRKLEDLTKLCPARIIVAGNWLSVRPKTGWSQVAKEGHPGKSE